MLGAIRLGLAQYRANMEASEILKEAGKRRLSLAGDPSREIWVVRR
jgi:hypothetical protein